MSTGNKKHFGEENEMVEQKIQDKKKTLIKLLILGTAAGFVNGLLGSGGGILVVFGLTPLIADSNGKRDVFANALAVMIPVSLISAISYISAGRTDLEGFGAYIIPAAIGGVIGAFLLDKIRVPVIKKLFAALVIWSGIYLMMRK